MNKLLFLTPLALLAGCFQPATPDETQEMFDLTLSIEDGWGELSEKQPGKFTTTTEVSSLEKTGLNYVIIRRDTDQETFAVLTLEKRLQVGTRVCATQIVFHSPAAHKTSLILAKPC